MTVARLETEMSSAELTEWIALYTIEHNEAEAARNKARSRR